MTESTGEPDPPPLPMPEPAAPPEQVAPRVSRPRLALLLGVVLLVLGAAAWGLWGLIGGPNNAAAGSSDGGQSVAGGDGASGSVGSARAAAAGAGGTTFAGYVDVTATPPYPFESPADDSGKEAILAFIVAAKENPCIPTWGTYYGLTTADSELHLSSRIAALRAAGGDVRISFGGQINHELSDVCTSPDALQQAYQSVIDAYQVDTIDFDVEGKALDDKAGLARRAAAAKALQQHAKDAGRPLSIWLTLPVAPQGLTEQGVGAVQSMLSGGVELAGVNGMAMDFGGSKPPEQSMANAVMSAAQSLQAQVASALGKPGAHAAADWAPVGITVMIGQNDVPAEQFTTADARTVDDFARTMGAGLLSMWSLNRDAPCAPPLPVVVTKVQTSCSGVPQKPGEFATTLASPPSGAPVVAPPTAAVAAGPAATSTATPVVGGVDDPATSPYPIWSPKVDYPADSTVVWHRNVYRAKFWSSDDEPGVPGSAGKPNPWAFVEPLPEASAGATPSSSYVVAAGTYPAWSATATYQKGDRVQVGALAYEAKWWTKGDEPGTSKPWQLVTASAPAN